MIRVAKSPNDTLGSVVRSGLLSSSEMDVSILSLYDDAINLDTLVPTSPVVLIPTFHMSQMVYWNQMHHIFHMIQSDLYHFF